jgi:hypothetical protein
MEATKLNEIRVTLAFVGSLQVGLNLHNCLSGRFERAIPNPPSGLATVNWDPVVVFRRIPLPDASDFVLPRIPFGIEHFSAVVQW